MEYKRERSRRCAKDLTVCQDCEVKLTDENWTASMQKYKRYVCRNCWSIRQKRYQANVPDSAAQKKESTRRRQESWDEERRELERRKRYNGWLKRKYGIDIETYDRMLEEQDHKCFICKTDEQRGKGGLHVDHCHKTGKVRKLLCANCNMMLGLVRDNPSILGNAIAYLDNDK
jgi:hypothetical protein